MSNDPIVAEIRKIRKAHAERFHNDVAAIFEDYRRMQKESGRDYVTFPPRRLEAKHPASSDAEAQPSNGEKDP